ncbi:glycerophosphodiester phosphodiesterase [Salegentibacter mishustinae]|uniref:Glycerophosphodiester phosphodiesterase n=1 Tax=Salegentibacter mishustinae TaxID=270918 RepID=A0A0Q9Z3Z9_9FLAO|nr:glycerophosphodiester phosphodiesterase family protein [Salegentibacter mishustinae]KRG27574.1 glycerophosphodiester phosphodiesterase [Salegentibacter mishustinae]PNW20369.1 glycerophosphodiester phosphodiesterase [Salegentibacter mishustinae]PZX63160.1 glycerophosphoryl diester phosphodiesterase [Salegentibacter mishustinae]GGW92234.1 glycerophosphoryl diester phosphodiesterase [Salegentibacter mishustinae]
MNLLKIGHRGAEGHLAENTLESIQKALNFGVDAIEIDVHRCETGELVVIHDFTLDRTTNGSGEVAKKSLTEIKVLKVEDEFEIPLLTEVLDFIQGKCTINIELKGLNTATSTAGIIKKYIAEKNWTYKDFIVSSFQKNELFQMRKLDEKVALGILSKASVTEAIELGKLLKASAIHPSLGIITRDNVKASHEAGFNVNVWTVNEPEDIQRMREFGVDGIISDFPDRLL